MVQITGKYQLERDANIGEFCKAIGSPYIGMIGIFNSELEITKEADKWILETITQDETQTSVFLLDVEYEEIMPSGSKLVCSATRNGNTLIITSTTELGKVIVRRYDFIKTGVILKITMAGDPQKAIRYFKRKDTSGINSKTLKKFAIGGIAAVVGGGLAVAAAPVVVAAAGFTSAGIAAGSMAASMMSVFGGGATAAGGLVATLQSVGALGTVLGSTAATAAAATTGVVAGAAVGTGVAHLAVEDSENE